MNAHEAQNRSFRRLARPLREAGEELARPAPGLFHLLSAVEDLANAVTRELPLVGFSPLSALPHDPDDPSGVADRREPAPGSPAGFPPRGPGAPAPAAGPGSRPSASREPPSTAARSGDLSPPRSEARLQRPDPVFSLKRPVSLEQGPSRAGAIPGDSRGSVRRGPGATASETGRAEPGRVAGPPPVPAAGDGGSRVTAARAAGERVGLSQAPGRGSDESSDLLGSLADAALDSGTPVGAPSMPRESGRLEPAGASPAAVRPAGPDWSSSRSLAPGGSPEIGAAPEPAAGPRPDQGPGTVGSAFSLLDSLADAVLGPHRSSTGSSSGSSSEPAVGGGAWIPGPEAERGFHAGPGLRRGPWPHPGPGAPLPPSRLSPGRTDGIPGGRLETLSGQQPARNAPGQSLPAGYGSGVPASPQSHLTAPEYAAPGAGTPPLPGEAQFGDQSSGNNGANFPFLPRMPRGNRWPDGPPDADAAGVQGTDPGYGPYQGLDLDALVSLVNEALVQQSRRHGVDLI